MSKNKKDRNNIVYSTNQNFNYEYSEVEELETLAPSKQDLRISLDKKNRNGKAVTLIQGFVGRADDLKGLCKILKMKCGSGGSVSDGNILIQGDFRDKISAYLLAEGFRFKRKGG